MIEIPTNCPSCDSALETVNDQLFCRNKQCTAQTAKKLQHFCKVMKIKGMGEKTLEKLAFEEVIDIYTFPVQYFIEQLGEKVGRKLFEEVEKSKLEPLELNLEAFSIPLFGGTASKKLAAVVGRIEDITEEKCKAAGIGQKASDNLMTWLASGEWKMLPLSFSTGNKKSSTASVANNIVVCVTGKLNDYKSRDLAKQYLESLGYTVTDSVTSKTNILIDEEGRPSSKREKAEKLNIPILTIQELIERNK